MSKDLHYYLESGELPDNDPELLAKLLAEASGDVEQSEPGESPESAADGAGEAKEVEDVVTDPIKDDTEKEPDGIATKDGKHIISYDVLKSEREARQQYQREVTELRRQLEFAKSGAGNPQTLAEFAGMTDEQMAELQEIFPDQYQVLLKQQEAYQAVTQRLAQAEQREAKRQADYEQQVNASVQEDIDNNPVLSHWQQNNPAIWDKCCALDSELLKDPDIASLPRAERFEKVAKAIANIYGSPIKAAPEPEKVVDTPKPTAKKTAQAKPPINSLSDIPGGEPAEASEKEKLENLSAAEIGDMLMKMTPEKQAAFLNSIG